MAYLKCVSASGAPSGFPMWPACRWDSFTIFSVLGVRASSSFLLNARDTWHDYLKGECP